MGGRVPFHDLCCRFVGVVVIVVCGRLLRGSPRSRRFMDWDFVVSKLSTQVLSSLVVALARPPPSLSTALPVPICPLVEANCSCTCVVAPSDSLASVLVLVGSVVYVLGLFSGLGLLLCLQRSRVVAVTHSRPRSQEFVPERSASTSSAPSEVAISTTEETEVTDLRLVVRLQKATIESRRAARYGGRGR